MVSQAQGGRDGSLFLQTTLMGRVSTHQNQTPTTQRRRKRSSLPSNDSTRSQRQRLCSNLLSEAPPTRIPLRNRLLNHETHGNNNQSRRKKRLNQPQGDNDRVIRRKVTPTPITLIPLVERLAQHDLHGQNQQAADGDTFGDQYPSSPAQNSSIFTFQNIGPQKQSASESAPQLNSKRFSKGKASVSMFAEHCLNESKLPHCDTFNPRMKSNSKGSFSYILNNKHEAPTAGWHLVGGTGFTMNSLFCSQKLNHGGDSTGLGRWAFSRFQGRGNTTLCIYAAYCPVKNPRNPGSVWNQHCRFFSDTRDDPNPNPRALFADDLCRSISARLAAGDSVILGLDHNEDVRTGSLGVKFKDLGMIDSILTLHSSLSPPATFNRNKTRTPIDAIWTSPNISVLRGGYCAFGGRVGMRSDHRKL